MKSVFLACVALFAVSALCARIGDTSSSLSGRLTNGDLGKRIDTEIDGAVQQGPLKDMVNQLLAAENPVGFEVVSYYKSANGERVNTNTLRNPDEMDGWYFSAILMGGRVVAESYQRVRGGRPSQINNFERDGLLVLNRGAGTWEPLNQMKTPGGEEIQAHDRNYGFVLDNRSVLAKFGDRPGAPRVTYAIFVRKELSDLLATIGAVQREEQREKQRESLNASLSGF